MIAAFLTLMCIMFISVDGFSSAISWVLIGVIALIWFTRMVWIDDANAHINWVDYWSRDGKERAMERRRWEEEARGEEAERLRREASERERHEAEAQDRLIAERKEQERKAQEFVPMVVCERCGKGARQIHRLTYPNGTNYAEYQCPYCGERKLKKLA